MLAFNIIQTTLDTFRNILKGGVRAFKPEENDYPKMGTMPLKHDIYREGKRKSYYRY